MLHAAVYESFFWRRYDMLYTSGFVDDVIDVIMTSCNGPDGAVATAAPAQRQCSVVRRLMRPVIDDGGRPD